MCQPAVMTNPEGHRWVEQLYRHADDPAPSRELWPDKDTGPYLIELEWATRKGRAEVVSFTVRTARLDAEDPSFVPLPSKSETETFVQGMTFRQIKPGERIEAARARAAADAVVPSDPETRKDSLTEFLRARTRPFAGPGRRGPAIDPEEYAEVLAIYLRAKEAGEPAARALAQRFNITEGAARKRYARARKLAEGADRTAPEAEDHREP